MINLENLHDWSLEFGILQKQSLGILKSEKNAKNDFWITELCMNGPCDTLWDIGNLGPSFSENYKRGPCCLLSHIPYGPLFYLKSKPKKTTQPWPIHPPLSLQAHSPSPLAQSPTPAHHHKIYSPVSNKTTNFNYSDSFYLIEIIFSFFFLAYL